MASITGLAAALLIGLTSFASGRPLTADDVNRLPASKPVGIASYGTGPLEYGELRLPRGKGPFPVVVVIHGGCWIKGFATLRNTAPLASALTAMGYATWNVEYRQVGDAGGGWPGTFLDWGRSTDYLRDLARKYPLDLGRVAVIGHSAGGYAALWVGARADVPAGSDVFAPQPLPIKLAIAIDGPTDLPAFVGPDAEFCGRPVVVPLMSGTPAELPLRYAIADLPTKHDGPAREALIAAQLLQPDDAARYRAAARAGQTVDVLNVMETGHFEPIAPSSEVWRLQVGPFLRKELSELKR